MTIHVYGGADGSFQLYEDDNESNAYLKDECVLTDMDLKWSTGRFAIHKAAGRLELIPQKRTWTVEFLSLIHIFQIWRQMEFPSLQMEKWRWMLQSTS